MFIVKCGHFHFFIGFYRHDRVIHQGRKRLFDLGGAVLKLDAFRLSAVGLTDVIDLRHHKALTKRASAEDLYALMALCIGHTAPLQLPLFLGTELGDLGILCHGKDHITCAVQRIVALHLQIPGIMLRAFGKLGDCGVLHSGQIFSIRLTLHFPLLIILRLAVDKLSKICDTNSSFVIVSAPAA